MTSRFQFGGRAVLHGLLQVALLFVCLFLLLAYGGVAAETVAFAAIVIFVILPVALFALGIPDHMRFVVAFAGLLLLVLAGWTKAQGVGFDALPFAGPLLQPYADPVWDKVRAYVPSVHPTISLTPGDAGIGALTIALPFGVFLTALLLFQLERHAHRALRWIALLGALISVCSILQFVAQPDMVLFVKKRAYADSLTGFFINRNTAATFFGLLLLLQFALAWQKATELGLLRSVVAVLNGASFRHERVGFWGLVYGLSSLATLCALMLTKSRGGILASFTALICLILLLLLFPAQGTGRQKVAGRSFSLRLGSAIVVICLSAVAFISLAGRVLLRGATQDFEGRVCVAPGVMAAIRDHMPWGAGLTSFRDVFPAYRDLQCGIYLVWDRAHSVYAEGLFSLGVVFVPALVLGVATLVIIYIRGLKIRRRQRYIASIGLSSLILVAIHSAFDFSLQIPGLATFFAVQSAAIAAICLLPAKQTLRVPADGHELSSGMDRGN